MDDRVHDGRLIEASWSDPTRFSELFERHYVPVYEFCARRVGRSESEDLAGDTFCKAFEYRRRFDTSRADARPWLYGIAFNLVRTHHRGRFRRGNAYARSALFAVTEVDVESVVEHAVDGRRRLTAVALALRQMPADDVDALLLHVWDGLSYDEVAETLAIPVSTVRSRLYHVRQRLREVLDADDPPARTPRVVQTPEIRSIP